MCTFLFQSGALLDMGQVYCEICKIGLSQPYIASTHIVIPRQLFRKKIIRTFFTLHYSNERIVRMIIAFSKNSLLLMISGWDKTVLRFLPLIQHDTSYHPLYINHSLAWLWTFTQLTWSDLPLLINLDGQVLLAWPVLLRRSYHQHDNAIRSQFHWSNVVLLHAQPSIIPPQCKGTGSRNSSLWKTRTLVAYKINTIAAKVLVTQGSRTSSAMVLT